MSVWKRLKSSIEWLEHLHFIASIVANWTVVLSAVAAALFGFWTWSAEHAYLPVALVVLGSFCASIWALNGIIWLRRQSRPSAARIAFDYSYGVTLDEVSPSHDPGNEKNCLEFRFLIRNVAPGPLKYNAERIDVIVDDRIKTARNITGTLPRDAKIQLKVGGFEKNVVDGFKERLSGSYEYTIAYGHPDDEYSRKTKKKIHFDLIKKEGKIVAAPWNILEESDEPILS